MAHFAKLDENNVVLEVNAVNNNELLFNGVEYEYKGIEFLVNWSGGYTNWKQTSYNGNFRGKFAGIGDTYDAVTDTFVAPFVSSDIQSISSDSLGSITSEQISGL
jgi:hypothetical protein